MKENKKDKKLAMIHTFIAGGFSGAISKTIMSPINVIKLRKQTKIDGFSKMSFLNYWKGNGYNCLRIFPYSGLQLLCFSHMKNKYGSDATCLHKLLFGVTAGMIATSITYPLDVIHFRKAVHNLNQPIYKNLYNGMGVTMISASLFNGIHMSIYDTLKHDHFEEKKWWHPIIHSSTASTTSQIICYPLDTIRHTCQLVSDKNYTVLQTGKNIYRKHGVLGFYSGIIYNTIKVAPTQAIRLTLFEYLMYR